MRRIQPRNDQDRFKGSLRHYHRTGVPPLRSWDEWINGKPGTSKAVHHWLRILGLTLTVIGGVGLLIGLFIALR